MRGAVSFRAVYYEWVKFLHVASVLTFVALHGVSMVVLFRIRGERDRKKIQDMLSLSGETTLPMYVSFLAIVVTGVLAGLKFHWFTYWWIWAAIGLLVASTAVMTAVAKPYFSKVKQACELRPSGVPRVSDEELGEILNGSATWIITAVGAGTLLGILYLMVMKPGA